MPRRPRTRRRRPTARRAPWLTASERRVADLAAQGTGNREIAQALFVSPRTVEQHLYNTYKKLGIQSRTQLAHALREPATTANPIAPSEQRRRADADTRETSPDLT